MKKAINKFLTASLVLALLGCSSDDKVIDIVEAELQTGAFLRITNTTGGAINKNDTSSSASVTFEFDGQDPSELASVDVFLTYTDNDDTDGADESVGPLQLGPTLTPDDFEVSDFGLPITTVEYTLGDALTLFGLNASQITGGDRFTLEWTVTLTDGRTFGPGDANGNVSAVGGFYSSPYNYVSLVVCPPQPGVWTIDMEDTYGDGWQTSSGGGGSGITFELNDGTVFEVSLCSDYGPRPGCVEDPNDVAGSVPSQGTATITVPEGTSSMVATFPGDFYGEIAFTITSPTGNVLANYSPGSSAGPIDLDYCNDTF
ncbi:hypothetical protein [Robiginitalea sp. SC105]|uniref:hypothetical protein n=1 Tax=Robiginitalea sp. SC105 TaxID=2762332 RepID=UPI00163B0457|nr:hypothetical protein [Robiginitalea sp. SC105]MBC2839612.1 hypothetical protein [Robiginitalea sp. SC105]